MPNFWKLVNEVINESDIILLVLDARYIDESRNSEIEQKIRRANKEFIYVINKIDLVDEKKLRKIKIEPHIKVSSKLHKGNIQLLKKLSMISKGEKITVGVLGYPNTGKSSVINALKGKLLYCKDKEKLTLLAIRLKKEYEDFLPRYNYYITGIKNVERASI